MKQVTITEIIVRTYVVEVNAANDEEAAKLAEDLIVNYEEVEEANLEDERVVSKATFVTDL